MPSGMISMFDSACPAGWSSYQPLEGRFVKGAQQAGATGGAAEHSHSFEVTARTSKDGNHLHMLATGETVSVDKGFFGHVGVLDGYIQAFEEGGRSRTKVNRVRSITDKDGAHDHLLSAQIDAPATEHLPPYVELVFCRKD